MQHTIKGGNAFASLRVALEPGETIKAEKNAMMAMSGNLKLTARVDGGLLRAIARRFSGESFFLQSIAAIDTPGWIMLAPMLPGAVVAIDLHGNQGITAEKGAFLAATSDVTISSKVQRLLKGFLGGEGFVVVKIGGTGTVFLNSFGSLETLTLMPDEQIIVDNTHLVAWEDGVIYSLGKGGAGWGSAILAGEGLVAKMTGPGRVWVQTRTLPAFRQRLGVPAPHAKSNHPA